MRLVQKEDYATIYKLNQLAFEQNEEAELVDALRDSAEYIPELEFVALHKNEIVGHIMYSRILVGNIDCAALALAPMSVAPFFQNKGIGAKLVKQSLKAANKVGFKSVVVLGHANYYPRFGFESASNWGIRFPQEVPDDALMALPLTSNGLHNCQGIVTYSSVFGL